MFVQTPMVVFRQLAVRVALVAEVVLEIVQKLFQQATYLMNKVFRLMLTQLRDGLTFLSLSL